MGRQTTIIALHEVKEINMTPLIDLTFLLLITFIITLPLVEQGIPVNLPRGKAEDLKDRQARSITLNEKGEIFLDRRLVGKEQLAVEMRAIAAGDQKTTVLVRGDEKIPYGRIVEVMQVLHDAKITRMALVTSAEEASKTRTLLP